ncbi:glycosyltransferase [Demequina sp. TTPB684]|uniref:glycosyltransferase n=1 Tax=unclassified Demequina TaxID=2620311 RepID=UPI001CF3DF2D|nr:MULTISPECIES: glycosyltransferase [unclassified Demequina]MCB2413617.1 glycosyltransferase [Demequina sp. TTPB684]UPU88259.1 glycosyltransferase [Demequina sp. TMPB413]
MRVVIATRIFGPEVSAASGILRTWAESFRDRGFDVTVLTAQPPRGAVIADPPGIHVRRARVIRDKQQYVRGYLSYMSFDIPLAFRLLFGRKADLYIVEPPPTTVAVVRVIGFVRRTPYVVRAADYWTEAAELATNSKLIIGTLKRLEAWGLQGAKMLFAAHQPLLDRLRAAGITSPALPIGFGADTKDFRYEDQGPPDPPVFVYAGTYSEWHAAEIFVDALQEVTKRHPGTRLLYYGNGEDREALRARARRLGLDENVEFNGPIPPSALSLILAGATASVASLAPVAANEYAVATKVYSSLASGCPVIFAGVGPTAELLEDVPIARAGVAMGYDVESVAEAMLAAAADPLVPTDRAQLAAWSATRYSLETIAQAVVAESLTIIGEAQEKPSAR